MLGEEGHRPPGAHCDFSFLGRHPGLLGSLSSLPALFVLLTTLKERLGSAWAETLSYTRHLPFLFAYKLHKRLCIETLR